MELHSLDALVRGRSAAGRPWWEFLRVATMSAGVYRLDAGEEDGQSPHAEDEVYVVLGGAATLRSGGDEGPVRPGTVAFVPAGEEHRFVDVTEELTLLVVFAPPETDP